MFVHQQLAVVQVEQFVEQMDPDVPNQTTFPPLLRLLGLLQIGVLQVVGELEDAGEKGLDSPDLCEDGALIQLAQVCVSLAALLLHYMVFLNHYNTFVPDYLPEESQQPPRVLLPRVCKHVSAGINREEADRADLCAEEVFLNEPTMIERTTCRAGAVL